MLEVLFHDIHPVGSAKDLAYTFSNLNPLSGLYNTLKAKKAPNLRLVDQEEEMNIQNITDNNAIYLEDSFGAIRIEGNTITLYYNWLPFTFFRFGRISKTLYLNDIQMIEYKGTGWFIGYMKFYFKHFNRPARVFFSKWFVWRRFSFNKKLSKVYAHLLNNISNNNNK